MGLSEVLIFSFVIVVLEAMAQETIDGKHGVE
jgi:hypothetical protein